MIRKRTSLLSLALFGTLLNLSHPAFADAQAPEAQPMQAPTVSATQTPAPAPQQLAWQRVGAPLSMEG